MLADALGLTSQPVGQLIIKDRGWRLVVNLGCSIFGPVPPLDLENPRGKNTKTREIRE
jgi:hypothetical protein